MHGLVRKFLALKDCVLKREYVPTLPVYIQVEPSTKCNYHCIACPLSVREGGGSHMTLDQFEVILDRIRPDLVTLSGIGEPTLNPALTEMIRLCDGRGVSVSTISNFGYGFRRLEPLLEARPDMIKISMDGATRETFHKMRGADGFDQLLSNVQRTLEFRQEKGQDLPRLRINCLVTARTLGELEDVIHLAEQNGVDTVYFQPLEYLYTFSREQVVEAVGDMTPESLRSCFERLSRLQTPVKHNVAMWLKQFPYIAAKYFPDHADSRLHTKPCLKAWMSAYVEIDGSVRPCCMFVHEKKDVWNMGNVLEQDFESIWNGERYREFRRLMASEKRPCKTCAHCVPESDLSDLLHKVQNSLPGFASLRRLLGR
jgi:radical SAM protein with 4Fe4S-binding SPASM domain